MSSVRGVGQVLVRKYSFIAKVGDVEIDFLVSCFLIYFLFWILLDWFELGTGVYCSEDLGQIFMGCVRVRARWEFVLNETRSISIRSHEFFYPFCDSCPPSISKT